MCAKYTFYKNPPNPETGESDSLYAKIVSEGRIGSDQLAEEIGQTCSFSPGVVKGIVQALSDRLLFHLRKGETVDLEGIGSFSVTLKTPRGITDPAQIRAESIRFNKVTYRCAPKLKQALKVLPLVRATLPPRKTRTEEERLANILAKLEKAHLVSSTDCMALNQCSRYQALKDLKKLYEAGQLTLLGRGKQQYYVLRENWQKGMGKGQETES